MLLLLMLLGDAWACSRAGTLCGSRGLCVCGRSWVRGRSLDTCFTYFLLLSSYCFFFNRGKNERRGYKYVGQKTLRMEDRGKYENDRD